MRCIFTRPVVIGRALTALAVCVLAPASIAATLLPPSISAARDREVDAVMPPLLQTPATARAAAVQQDATLLTAASRAFPQVTSEFKQFLEAQARLSYARRSATAKVASPTAFAEMQRYLFNRYNGLTVLRSVHQGGKVFDCIPREQQPALRDGSTPVAPPTTHADTSALTAIDTVQRCDAGSVPLERVSLADISKHADLRSYLRGTTPRIAAPTQQAATVSPARDVSSVRHYYSVIYLDTAGSPVTGAGADLNTWVPAVGDNDAQSISQIWLGGYTSQRVIQTLEAGWQTQPAAGWGTRPLLFIYSTQDGYVSTGCHNLDCADFVQVSTANVLGAPPPSGYSTAGGKQAMMHVEFQRNAEGYWWFRLNGEWIGYYKAELYEGDIAEGSSDIYISAGGEISTWDGRPSAPMGSGRFAAAGYRQAAFQANHFYRDAALVTHPAQRLSSMNVEQPACYTLAIAGFAYPFALGAGVTRTSLSPEMTNGGFYFGGPGCSR